MLEAAREALCEVGVLGHDQPMPPFMARMSGNLALLVYPPGQAFYLVKIGLQSNLRREFDGFSAGHAAYPEGVPRPLALSRHRSFSTLVTTGIRYAPLGAPAMQNPVPGLQRGLAAFFAATRTEFSVDMKTPHSQRIRDAFEILASAVAPESWHRYVDAVAESVDRLPAIRQHGDFSLNNLGLRQSALVVLDWEDFGRECVPGYDVALLLLSLNQFNVTRVAQSTSDTGMHRWILRAGTEDTGLSRSLFIRLLPAYLALIARMKSQRGYRPDLAPQAVGGLLDALARTDDDLSAGTAAVPNGSRE